MSEIDLGHHYRVLKQFLDISDDSSTRNKSNSTRAARAREKLLKLSGAQFKELSTDVYDELRRRIDESRGEPDYLLPKSSFHPKRNQARQKLSSLPQARFKDLVSDISYEIERRGLHKDKVTTIPDNSSPTGAGIATTRAIEAVESESLVSSPRDHDELSHHKDSISSDVQNQTMGIQSKTVVPTKANLTWSSDEEEEEEAPVYRSAVAPVAPVAPIASADSKVKELTEELHQKDNLILELNDKISQLEHDHHTINEKHRLLQDDYDYSVSQNKSLSNELDSLSEEKKSWVSKSIAAPVDTREIETLKSSIAALRLENQSLKNTVGGSPTRPTRELNGFLNKSPTSAKNERTESMKKDIEVFFERLSNLEASPPKEKANSFVNLKNDVSKWQRKYEEARSNTLSSEIKNAILSKEELKSFVSSYGLLSIRLVSDLQALVESFLIYLNGKSQDSDILFEKISKISILANEIATQGDNQHPNSNEHSVCLREAVTYALSATRYFAVYSAILPKIVVERALGEVCFTLCDLITVAKLNEDSSNSRTVQAVPNALPKSASKNSFDEEFGARPLRMANRLRESQSQAQLQQNGNGSENENGSPFDSPIAEPTSSRNVIGAGNGGGFLRKISPFGGVRQIPGGASNNSSTNLNEVYPERKVSLDKEIEPESTELKPSKVESPKSNISALASRFETSPKNETRNGLSSVTSSPQGKSPGVLQLASKLQDSTETLSYKSSPTRSPQAKKNILDKVRQFEVREEKPENKSSVHSPTQSINSRKSSLGLESENDKLNDPFDTREVSKTETINGGIGNRKNSVGSGESGRGKGLFQSIRDRLTSENDGKIIDETTNSEGLNSDNEKVELSTDKVLTSTAETTPSKENDDDAQSDYSPVKSGGFFQSIKERLTTSAGEDAKKPVSSSASDTTVQLDRADSVSKHSFDSDDRDPFVVKSEVPGVKNLPIESNTRTDYSLPKVQQQAEAPIQVSIPKEVGTTIASTTLAPRSMSAGTSSLSSNGSEGLKSSLSSKRSVKKVNYSSDTKTTNIDDKAIESEEEEDSEEEESESESESESENNEESQARQRQEYRKSMAAATFNVDLFDIDDPDNTLTQVLLYLEHQTVQVITTIQSLLSAIKKPNATRGDLREKSQAITIVISQMTEATNTSMNQTRNAQLKEHGSWVVKSLEDCHHRMNILGKPNSDKSDEDFADKNFKQRLAGISFDIAKCTKELVKTVEEASLKEDIANLDARLGHHADLT